ncbi:MAG: GAF domain-containing protein [Verrucomicrobia bacterium]|nr:GAF domain-containing protein [Verrucomicrobiota bacterium]
MTDDPVQLRQRYERLELLYQVSQVIHSTLDPQQALRLILSEAVRLMRASSGSLVLVSPSGFLEIEAAHGLPEEAVKVRLRVGQGITGWVARTGKPARVGDVGRDPRYVALLPNVRSELAVPLEVAGQVRGVLNVDADREEAFTEGDQELLEALAVQAARVIHHTWLYAQLEQKVRLFETLVRVGQTINSTINLGDALAGITREACQLMGAKMCSLLMLDESRAWLDLKAHFGAGPDYLNKPRLSVEDSLVGVVVRRRKPTQVENVQTSGSYANVEVARREGIVSLLSVPLLFSGRAIGALNVYKGEPYLFANEEIRILSAFAELSALAIEKARLYERVVDVEEQLRQSEKLSALGLLAAEVAHEIRNPLTVLKMLYHSLDLRYPADDPRARDAQLMGENLDHLNRIVERILDFARRTEPELTRVDVNQVITDLGLLTRHKLRNQGVQLVRELAEGLPPIMADATQLEQAFLNLTLNAAEAMPSGGTLTISTRPVRVPRRGQAVTHVVVEFKDTGEGMSDEAMRHARDGSLLATTKKRGTGLGLAIVRRVVEAHGGKMTLKSRIGYGTSIGLTLPVEAVAGQEG